MRLFRRRGRERECPEAVRQVWERPDLLEALGAGPAVIYKHSDRCAVCFWSQREVRKFAEAHPDVPVVQIDVIGSRSLSDHVAERFGVRHESPQAIVVEGDRVLWDGSHLDVTAGKLEAALGR